MQLLPLAHGLIQRADLPIPEWLFVWAAGVVLVVSFVALAVLWQKPVLEGRGDLPAGRGDVVPQTFALALLVFLLYAGFAGADGAEANILPTFVFVVFWVGLVFASILLGDVFHVLNPWRAAGRLLHFHGVRPYPARLGRWPAVVGLLCFTWLELCSLGQGEHAHRLATAASIYTGAQLLGCYLYGTEPWIRHGEAFSVYFGLFARLSPGRGRRPLSALTHLDASVPGTVAVVAVMIGSVTYDGLSGGQFWTTISQDIEEQLIQHMSLDAAVRLTSTLGLLLCVCVVGAFYRLGIAGASKVKPTQPQNELAQRFIHTLVPIAVVYAIAHYLTLFIFQGQAMFFLISDPLGRGWDLFGTADSTIHYFLGQNGTWYLQVGFVVAGHVAALALAHDRALVIYKDARSAARSQYWMLGVMVGFTTLALWLLAQAGGGQPRDLQKQPIRHDPLVDFSKKPPYVNGLEIDQLTGEFLLTTNKGFWRISKDGSKVRRVRGVARAQDGRTSPVGTFLSFLPVGGGRLIGSGHPDVLGAMPQFLGFIQSDDDGKTWTVLSRLGRADLHKLVQLHGKLYAFDAVLSAMLISDDGGKSFTEHFTPRGLVIDFAVDPTDPKTLVIANEEQLFRSTDSGDSWRPGLRGVGMRLAWPAPDRLYRAMKDGSTFVSADGGKTWQARGKLPGEPYKLHPLGPDKLDLALADGSIYETNDGLRTVRQIFKPGPAAPAG